MSRFDGLWHAEPDPARGYSPDIRTFVGPDGIIRDVLDPEPPQASQPGRLDRQPFERRRLRVYIAGPITANPFEGVNRGIMWGRRLFVDGLAPYVPHFDALYFLPDGNWNAYLEYDLEFVSVCEAIFRLDGDSKGADLECRVARDLDIPIFTEAAYPDLLDFARDRVLLGERMVNA